jgi:hypothetical protein
MAKTVVGLFEEQTDAQNAVDALVDRGFPRDQISVVASETGRQYVRDDRAESVEVRPSGAGAAVGAVSGAVIGGGAGLLVGLGALAVPGLGPLVALGPLVTTLAGMAAGTVAGGLLGALVDIGVPKEEAEVYVEGVRRGYILVTLQTSDEEADTAAAVMRSHGAIDTRERAAAWRQSGWAGHDASAQPYTAAEVAREREVYSRRRAEIAATTARAAQQAVAARDAGTASTAVSPYGDFDAYKEEFRRDFEFTLSNRGYTFDHHLPAYRYGYALATDPRYDNKNWDDVEGYARTYWEERNPGTWEEFMRPIRYAWDTVRNRR